MFKLWYHFEIDEIKEFVKTTISTFNFANVQHGSYLAFTGNKPNRWVTCASIFIHLILLEDRVVSGARFLTGGVFECDITHRRCVAVLCILYNIQSCD